MKKKLTPPPLPRLENKLKLAVQAPYKWAYDLLFKRLPSRLGSPLAILLALAPVGLLILAWSLLNGPSHPSKYTVMVTNHSSTGGGSGVIWKTSSSESIVLTNAHVCKGALKNGGKIKLVNGNEHMVVSFKLARDHDICSIKVAANLGAEIPVAKQAPARYEEALVTGHPSLMPNVITKGHFGGREIIQIMTGIEDCKLEDLEGPYGLYCLLFGKKPVIKKYESQIVTATIMPGSSGSAVLNDRGELSGLVFAGNANGLSYAYCVPFEAVKNYMDKEAPSSLGELRPWDSKSDLEVVSKHGSAKSFNEQVKNLCQRVTLLGAESKEQKELCDIHQNISLF